MQGHMNLDYFNSHPHEEDDVKIDRCCFNSSISTHILTRRMTLNGGKASERNNNFNSHPHEEDDVPPWKICTSSGIFQLTSSRGGWLLFALPGNIALIFQLTSSRGGWLETTPINLDITNISTHILTRRMTTGLLSNLKTTVFQLTSSRGGWQNPLHHVLQSHIFQLTSSRGGWPVV